MKKSKVYVFCPNDFVSGGPDALHQLVYYLNFSGINAEIVYYAFSKKHVYEIPASYTKYVSSFIKESDFIDDSENIVVLPESAADKLRFIKKSKVYLWWLSVDYNCDRSSFFWKIFYFATLPARVIKNFDYYRKRFGEAIVKTLQKREYTFASEPSNVNHLCASYYALDFVTKKSKKSATLCVEPISKFFLERYVAVQRNLVERQRTNEILYNPRKSGIFVQKLIEQAPDLTFIPLTGMSQDELIEKYSSAKLYVDFGPFPGAERMPKEAVLFGCTVLTGRNGASNFYDDVPIMDEYKFADYQNQIEEIIAKIREIIAEYDLKKKDFELYKNRVLNLEGNFIKSLKEIFYG